MSTDRKIVLTRIGSKKDIIKIIFTESLSANLLNTYLAAAFNKCFKNKFYKIILDLMNIDDLSSIAIATIIEATAKVRTKDGDIKIINLSENSKQAFSSFNAFAYLSVPKEVDG